MYESQDDLIELAEELLASKDFTGAVHVLDNGITLNGLNPSLFLLRAEAKFQMKQFVNSLDDIGIADSLLEGCEFSSRVMNQTRTKSKYQIIKIKGKIYFEQGNLEEAEALLQEYLEYDILKTLKPPKYSNK